MGGHAVRRRGDDVNFYRPHGSYPFEHFRDVDPFQRSIHTVHLRIFLINLTIVGVINDER